MASTRTALRQAVGHMDESVGVRESPAAAALRPTLSPKDVGRMPLRTFGRVDIEQVVPDPQQPRKEFDPDDIQRLAESIRAKGQLHPIRVRWDDGLRKWIIITGERRWRATKAAGLEAIDCYFVEGDISPAEVLEQQVIENLLREDLKPVEEARAFEMLMNLNGWNGRQLAEHIHVDPDKVTRTLSLLKLPGDIQQQVDAGEVSAAAGYHLSRLPDDRQRRELAEQIAGGTLTRDSAARAVRQRKGKPKDKPRGVRQTFILESGWTVIVSSKRHGNYHEMVEALREIVEEVEHRIANNSQLF
jgi:ParB family chromosome partitioning protein